VTARNQLERDVKRTRSRVEDQLQRRRNQATKLVRQNSRAIERSAESLQLSAEGFVSRFQGEQRNDRSASRV
jgi:hypothetical protein